jgi:hypothetical protein
VEGLVIYQDGKGNETHFFLTVKGIGQIIAEKRESSDMRRAKHTTCQLALVKKHRTYGNSRAVYQKKGNDQLLPMEVVASSTHSHFDYCLLYE